LKKITLILLIITITIIGIFAETNAKFKAKEGQFRTLYLKNDNIFYGEVIDISDDNSITLNTKEGVLIIPGDQILIETLKIKKNNGTTFSGKLLGETEVSYELKTDYGNAVVNKADIKDLKRFFGGKREKVIQQKVFFAGEEQVTDLFGDPTAFVLPPYAFYISGLSMGYGFSNRFHLFTKITNNFGEDLNLTSRYVILKKAYGAKKMQLASELNIFSNHDMNKEIGRYYDNFDIPGLKDDNVLKELYGEDNRELFWKLSLILSFRNPLKSGRGNWGFHTGVTINQLITEVPKKTLNYEGNLYELKGGFSDTNFHANRVFAGFDYDLSKRIKFISIIYFDPGNHYLTIRESFKNYFENDFIQAGHLGERKPIDFDFGVTFTPTKSLRIGFHFQNPFLTVYWKFLDY
jgi:hypothetical protein